jgi:hypothetical protein
MPILCWIMGGGFVVKLSNLCRAGSLTSGSGPIVLLVPSTVKKGRNMAVFNLGPDDALYYEHTPPDSEQGYTFVFFNALTGATDNWEALICPRLREAGHGTLSYNLRGQADSRFGPDVKLTAALVVEDAIALFNELKPRAPFMSASASAGFSQPRPIWPGARQKVWFCSTPCAKTVLVSGGSTMPWYARPRWAGWSFSGICSCRF